MERKLQTILLALVAMMVPFGAWAQENTTYEAKWGTSAEAESFEYGTLEEAFSAARSYVPERGGYVANDIAYIQLQSDVNSEGAIVSMVGPLPLTSMVRPCKAIFTRFILQVERW